MSVLLLCVSLMVGTTTLAHQLQVCHPKSESDPCTIYHVESAQNGTCQDHPASKPDPATVQLIKGSSEAISVNCTFFSAPNCTTVGNASAPLTLNDMGNKTMDVPILRSYQCHLSLGRFNQSENAIGSAPGFFPGMSLALVILGSRLFA